ncbi:MAG TPA: HigA family addiction module antitoxin [Puia sp.]|nr:HigA family addiction module antitoxin [Puia sp.]
MLKRALPPSHPGAILRELFMEDRKLTITELAKGLGMTRANLSAIINERAGISPELAVKLSAAFGNSATFWTNLQTTYELWHAEKKVKRSTIHRFKLPGGRQSAHA